MAARSTILVVGDDLEDMTKLAVLLGIEHDARAAANAVFAFKFVRQGFIPDLAVIGIAPPDRSGFELCRDLLKDPRTAHVQVLFMASAVLADDVRLARELGAVDYLRIPVDGAALRERINMHLARLGRAQGLSEACDDKSLLSMHRRVVYIDIVMRNIVDLNIAMAGRLGGEPACFLGKSASNFPILKELMPSIIDSSELERGEYIRHVAQQGGASGAKIPIRVECTLQWRSERTVMKLSTSDIVNVAPGRAGAKLQRPSPAASKDRNAVSA